MEEARTCDYAISNKTHPNITKNCGLGMIFFLLVVNFCYSRMVVPSFINIHSSSGSSFFSKKNIVQMNEFVIMPFRQIFIEMQLHLKITYNKCCTVVKWRRIIHSQNHMNWGQIYSISCKYFICISCGVKTFIWSQNPMNWKRIYSISYKYFTSISCGVMVTLVKISSYTL